MAKCGRGGGHQTKQNKMPKSGEERNKLRRGLRPTTYDVAGHRLWV